MKKRIFLFCSVILITFQTGESQKSNSQPVPFQSELLSHLPNVRDLALYENEMYFTLQSYQEEYSCILVSKKEKGSWSAPQVVGFSGLFIDMEPFLTSNGLEMYFASNRPTDPNSKQAKDFDIWYVERKSPVDPWSAPIHLGEPLNTKYNEFYPSLTLQNNLYYTSDRPDSKGKDDIFMCKSLGPHRYTDPVSLSDSINTAGYEFNAYVAPDESFMIYTGYNRKGGLGSGDLFISFCDAQGNWSNSKTLGNINSDKMDYCPFVDIKSGILYFTSRRNSVRSSFEKPQALDELLKEFNRYENGLSRLYQVNIKNLIR